MAKTTNFLALDLGASSGRAVAGRFDGEILRLEEVHRFDNGPVSVLGHWHWDVLRVLSEVKAGLARCALSCGGCTSLGVDTWGLDYALLDAHDELLGNPYNYRDSRTDGMLAEAFRRVPRAEIFEQTGIQFLEINTLYQLLSMAVQGSPQLEAARTLLNTPDFFNFWLTGHKANEFTIVTTTQCYNPRTGDWAWALLEKMGLPTRIFGEIVPPGTLLAPLHRSLAEETGAGRATVIAVAGHDTGSAVAAVPARSDDHVFISSGTWSVLGVEIEQPLITPQALAYNFTNEGGAEGTFRFMKNIVALWILQECRRAWSEGRETLSWDELTRMAAAAKPFASLINPDDHVFLPPGDMPNRIRNYCQQTGQPVPETQGAIARCILESIALAYRRLLGELEEVQGRTYSSIHIIGGGSKNGLLNQMAADATGRTVIAGPAEATSIGNILLQALALGHIGSLEEGRALVRNSFLVTTYEPSDQPGWDEAYARYRKLV